MVVYNINKGKNLKFCREYRGYTRYNLSKHIEGCTAKQIKSYEEGCVNSISDEDIIKIIRFLNWPLSFLYIKPLL